ncbi:hypothetical protein BH23CHL5_BH23CHL5_06560 [soil metagenome]
MPGMWAYRWGTFGSKLTDELLAPLELDGEKMYGTLNAW